jgi:hypothetical protein
MSLLPPPDRQDMAELLMSFVPGWLEEQRVAEAARAADDGSMLRTEGRINPCWKSTQTEQFVNGWFGKR